MKASVSVGELHALARDEEQERTLSLLLLDKPAARPCWSDGRKPPPVRRMVPEPLRGPPAAWIGLRGPEAGLPDSEASKRLSETTRFPCSARYGAAVDSAARYVCWSDLRIRQKYRLAA
jgi:hypothetical protein